MAGMSATLAPSVERALTRADAMKLVDRTREIMLDRLGQTDGLCKLATGLLGLQMFGYSDAELVTGDTGDGWHWWMRCDGLRLDPTADQFRDLWVYYNPIGLPLVCRDRFRRSSYGETRSEALSLPGVESLLMPFMEDAVRGPWLVGGDDDLFVRAGELARDAHAYATYWLNEGLDPISIDLRNMP